MEEQNTSQSAPLLEMDYRLNHDEILACLKLDFKLNGTMKKRIQIILLILMTVFFITGYIMSGFKTHSSLFMAFASLLIIAAIWFVPQWHISHQAKLLAEDGSKLHFRLYENEIVFDGNNIVAMAISECKPFLYGNMLILEIGREIIGIPCRAAGEDGYRLLLDKFGMSR